MSLPVIAIYDIGKTSKKLMLLNEQYKIVWEDVIQIPEIKDEDNYPCENLHALTAWVKQSFDKVRLDKKFVVKAVNFAAYGASFVHVNEEMQPVLPLYNYLKPYPEELQKQFYKTYGGSMQLARETASPVLGNLNSGLQLYWLKHTRPKPFKQIKYSLHLPQYLSFLLCGRACSDITSIGCHTSLWNFDKSDYHQWVYNEKIKDKLAPVVSCTTPAGIAGHHVVTGTGMNDSSAALIPYLAFFHEPFILLSTGKWCISFNPFNPTPVSNEELRSDCLSYLSYQAKPVKASRLFAGNEHERQVKKLAAHFEKPLNYYQTIRCDKNILRKCINSLQPKPKKNVSVLVQPSAFEAKNLYNFVSYEDAYHQLISDIVAQQKWSTNLVLKGSPVKRIFVDGAFSKNCIYMHLLAEAFPKMEVYAASVTQASTVGAALALHRQWNTKPLPSDMVTLKYHSAARQMSV